MFSFLLGGGVVLKGGVLSVCFERCGGGGGDLDPVLARHYEVRLHSSAREARRNFFTVFGKIQSKNRRAKRAENFLVP